MKKILFLFVFISIAFIPATSLAHSGRTDSSGGHNCRTGSCAGTYHYHNGGSSYTKTTTYSTPKTSYSNYGYSQSDVKIIQNFLNVELGRSMKVDGIYGAGTKAAVKSFQYKYGLSADGVVGARTIAKMVEVSNGSITSTATKSQTTTQCNSNYSGCVPIASDVDCAGGSGDGPKYVRGPVRVIGYDVYGLDRDGDGIGCE